MATGPDTSVSGARIELAVRDLPYLRQRSLGEQVHVEGLTGRSPSRRTGFRHPACQSPAVSVGGRWRAPPPPEIVSRCGARLDGSIRLSTRLLKEPPQTQNITGTQEMMMTDSHNPKLEPHPNGNTEKDPS